MTESRPGGREGGKERRCEQMYASLIAASRVQGNLQIPKIK